MEGLDEVFDNLNEEAPAVETQEAPQEVTETVQEVAETPEPVVEAPATEAPQEREDKSVPLATFLDMRDKLKEAERRAAELEAARQQAQPQRQAPDPFDNPAEYAAYQNEQVQAAVTANKFEMSDLIARQSHGDEAVEAATSWAMERAKSNPAFAAEYMRERHPIDWIVRQHRQEADLADYRTDPVAFARRILEANGQQIAQTPVTPAPQPTVATPKAPPRSLVNAPSHGGVSEVPVGKLAGMDTVFPG